MSDDTTTTPRLLTTRETAKYLAISERTLFSLAATGRIQSVKIGRRCVRYDMADLDEFIRLAKGSDVER